jgi:aspartate/methionine/tyrosine aminotransferase
MRLASFALERFFARWEFSAELLLCASDVEGVRMAELLGLADDDGRRRWETLRLGYTEAPGLPDLRAEIAALYETVEPDDVLVFSGAEEAIFALHTILLEPGSHALIVGPAYQSLAEVARGAGAEVSRIQLREPNGWRLDIDEVASLVRPDTRLILINEPHNPTGALSDRRTFDRLAAVVAASSARLVVDEVYRFLEFDPSHRLPAAADVSPTGVSIGVLSKSFALAGLRIGWVASRDRDLLARLAAFKDYTTICNSAPSEILALIALRARERLLSRNRGIVLANMVLLDDFFERWRGTFEWVRPRGGSIGLPSLMLDVPVDRFCEELVTETGVLLAPGGLFGASGNSFRLGFGRTNLPEALARLEQFVQHRYRA